MKLKLYIFFIHALSEVYKNIFRDNVTLSHMSHRHEMTFGQQQHHPGVAKSYGSSAKVAGPVWVITSQLISR